MKSVDNKTNIKNRKTGCDSGAFTLIELLLVVAIISILAAMLLYNYAGAQARAKVSRARADMRTIAVAVELYHTDHNVYPPNPLIPGSSSNANKAGYNVSPTSLTTPIAYLTSLPIDPFRVDRQHVYDYYFPGLTEQIPRYSYYTIINRAEWETMYQRDMIVSLVAVDDVRANQGAFHKYGHWVMWSVGPDQIAWWAQDDFTAPGDPGSPLKSPAHPPWGFSFDVPYDPTNGTASFGNVFRSQKGDPQAFMNVQGATPRPTPEPTGTPEPSPSPGPSPGPTPIPTRAPSPTPGWEPPPPPTPPPGGPPPSPTPPGGGPPPQPTPAPGGTPEPGPVTPLPTVHFDTPVPSKTPLPQKNPYEGTPEPRPTPERDAVGTTDAAVQPVSPPRDGRPDRSDGVSSRQGPNRRPGAPPAETSRDDAPPTSKGLEQYVEERPQMAERHSPPRRWKLLRIDIDDLALILLMLGLICLLVYVLSKYIRWRGDASDMGLGAVLLSNDSIPLIRNLEKRESLDLSGSRVTDEGLKHLGELEALKDLNLFNTQVRGTGLGFLSGLNLKTLNLAKTQVTDAGLANLDNLPELETLVLSETSITDEALMNLRRFPKLRFLNIVDTRCTTPAVTAFSDAMPKCEVRF